ncbi:MAG: hypothetical protein WCY77_02710 [Weeksellaceae bacterium]
MTTSSNLDLETKVIERFVIKAKRDRYLTFIKNDKTREKFINDLHHMNFLKVDLFDKIEGNEFDAIKERIKSLGVLKDCYIISDCSRLDKKKLDIDTALRETIGSDSGTIIVFGDAEIIYSEAEGFNNRLISRPTKFN